MNPTATRALLTICCAFSSALILTAQPERADAFCGFYVSGATGELFNNATQVVLMREGTRTVLSMQNNYQGPPADFAMVIPVPVVLQKENVKTLPDDVFDRVDKMAAPRLVEYWETDPCYKPPEPSFWNRHLVYKSAEQVDYSAPAPTGSVRIEAQFKVGEYEIVILSADDAAALDTWLRDNKYNIPQGAEPVLRPYVQSGTKFFVAKVDVTKVKFDGDKALLSPLRFHYDTQDFSLPVRLGLLNANGPQDLIVHILARNQRYEVANYKNVSIPTNLRVDPAVQDRFAEFYAALFDQTLQQNPGAVITEYSWAAGSCDPCPGATLQQADFDLLGADALQLDNTWDLVLTRLHARYTKDNLGEDLVFKAAPPVVGGRGTPDAQGTFLEQGMQPAPSNNFQGRYAMLHPWAGAITCSDPVRGRWGGPPSDKVAMRPTAAQDLASAPRGNVQLTKLVQEDIPSINLKTELPHFAMTPTPPSAKTCGACAVAPGQQAPRRALPLLALGACLALAALLRRR
jgi:hypothetical protein